MLRGFQGFQGFKSLQKNRPSQLNKIEDDLVDKKTGLRYKLEAKLQGRGQAGEANFYKQEGSDTQWLIKEDAAATCLLEGTAYFASQIGLLPSSLITAVNYATLGFVHHNDNSPPMIVSIQKKVMPMDPKGAVRPWDELVYGRKRNPRTIWSEESWNPSGIQDNIYSMNSDARWQLAAAILQSMVAGDESLHVGQYMAIVDNEENIKNIKRIDLGARERFALVKNEDMEMDPFNCSSFYQGGFGKGQFSKNYLNFLMAEEFLKTQYAMLWAKLASEDEKELYQRVYDSSLKAMMELKNMPEKISEPSKEGPIIKTKEQVIEAVLEVVNRKAKDSIVLKSDRVDDKAFELAKHIAKLDAQRVLAMRKAACLEYENMCKEKKEKVAKCDLEDSLNNLLNKAIDFQWNSVTLKSSVQKISEDSARFIADFHEKIKACKDELDKASDKLMFIKKIQIISEVAIDTLECEKLCLMTDSEKNQHRINYINQNLEQYYTLRDCAIYYQKTSNSTKRLYVGEILNKAILNYANLKNYLRSNRRMIEELTKHRGRPSAAASQFVTHKSEGLRFLEKLFRRFNLPQNMLTMTAKQSELLHVVKSKNYSHALQIIQKNNLYV